MPQKLTPNGCVCRDCSLRAAVGLAFCGFGGIHERAVRFCAGAISNGHPTATADLLRPVAISDGSHNAGYEFLLGPVQQRRYAGLYRRDYLC